MSRRTLTLSLALVLAATTLALPLASAQVAPAFRLASAPEAREVLPGQSAAYDILVWNDALVDRSAKMSLISQLPAGWTYSFSVDPVPVPAAKNASTTLSIHVPSDAKPQSLTLVYEANDSLSGFTRDDITLTVKAPPTPETQVVGPPRLRLTASAGSEGEAGELVQGTLTLENTDPSRPSYTATIAVAGASGWRAYVRASDATRVLDLGAPVTIPLFAEVPELAADETRQFTITVHVEGTTFVTQWSVLGRAPAAASAETTGGAPATNGTDAAGTGATTGGTTTAPRGPLTPSGPNLELLVLPLELRVPSDGSVDATVRLANTGNTELDVALAGTAPPTWRPMELATRTLRLAPGETQDVALTITAPDVPPGGRATGRISAETTSGLVRGADFVITVIPGAPRDETSAATLETPVAPEGGLPAAQTTALVVVGLAAVGSAAAVVASRPLREKLLWGAAGLYTRLARPDVLGHEDREKLYRLIETQPGIHFHALQRDLGWNTGTLTYHLRVLEKHGFMVSRRDGLYRRLYLVGAAPRKEVFENQGPTGLRADVMEAIRNQPGISQSDLALGLGANKQTVNYHVKALERAGTIRVEKRGRDTYLYPQDATTPTGPGVARV